MMYLKAQVRANDNGKEFGNGIISTSKDVDITFNDEFGGEIETFDLNDINFDTWSKDLDDDAVARWIDKLENDVFPIICIESVADNTARVINHVHKDDVRVDVSSTPIAIDTNAFQNGLKDIVALIG